MLLEHPPRDNGVRPTGRSACENMLGSSAYARRRRERRLKRFVDKNNAGHVQQVTEYPKHCDCTARTCTVATSSAARSLRIGSSMSTPSPTDVMCS